MISARSLLICLPLLLAPLHASNEQAAKAASVDATLDSTRSETLIAAPEPNTMLLAGLGGLALLFFAMRRK